MSGYRRILTGEPVPRPIIPAPASVAPAARPAVTAPINPVSPPAQQLDLLGQPVPSQPGPARRGSIADPRPDLSEDTTYWTQVFVLAIALDVKAGRKQSPLFGALHGMRIAGTRLVKSEKTGKLVFRPLVGESGWASETEYKQAADEYLRPFDQDMKELLRQLNRGDVGAETRENCPWGGDDGKLATTINNLNAGQINIYDLVEEDSE